MKRHSGQKVSLNMDRHNITPSYLRTLHGVVLKILLVRRVSIPSRIANLRPKEML